MASARVPLMDLEKFQRLVQLEREVGGWSLEAYAVQVRIWARMVAALACVTFVLSLAVLLASTGTDVNQYVVSGLMVATLIVAANVFVFTFFFIVYGQTQFRRVLNQDEYISDLREALASVLTYLAPLSEVQRAAIGAFRMRQDEQAWEEYQNEKIAPSPV